MVRGAEYLKALAASAQVSDICRRLSVVSLRGSGMFLRLLLVLAVAKYLGLGDAGIFGLFSAAIVYGQLIIGAELYNYYQREVISAEDDQKFSVLVNQAFSLGLAYAVLIPSIFLTVLVATDASFPLFWFIPILFFEAISQEINRNLICLGCQLKASLITFIRQGGWIIILGISASLPGSPFSLEMIFLAWFMGVIFAASLGLFFLHQEVLISTGWMINKKMIASSFKIAALFFISAIFFRLPLTADRFFVEAYFGYDVLGQYTVFASLAMAVVALLDPLVLSFSYPDLIKLASQQNWKKFKLQFVNFAIAVFAVAIFLQSLVVIIAPMLFELLNRPELASNIELFYWLCGSALAFSISMIPHYGLYSLSMDKSILAGHFLGACTFLFTIFFYLEHLSIVRIVPIAVLLSFSVIFLTKLLLFLPAVKNRGLI